MTTDAFIRNRPQTLNRFLKATLEGIKYAKANPDFTVRVLGKYTRNTDTKLLASAFKSYVLGYIRDVPTVTFRKWKRSWKTSRRAIPKPKASMRDSSTIPRRWNSWRRKDSSRNCIRDNSPKPFYSFTC